MTYSAKSVANYFLDIVATSKETITPMKIQKLVYMAHGWSLALVGSPLINEQVEAWQFGPVIPTLYHEFKPYGSGAIKRKATNHTLNGLKFETETPSISNDDEQTKALLDKVWEVYGHYTAYQLSNMTHQDGTPWHITWNKEGERTEKGTDIPLDIIKEHYIQKIAG